MAREVSSKVPGTDPEMYVPRWYVYRKLIAVLLLVCGGLLAPQTARAGCGNNVRTKTHAAGAESAGLDLGAAFGALPDAPPMSELPKPPASSCSGLRCSQERPAPLPPAVPRIDLWGCLDLSAFSLRNPSSP